MIITSVLIIVLYTLAARALRKLTGDTVNTSIISKNFTILIDNGRYFDVHAKRFDFVHTDSHGFLWSSRQKVCEMNERTKFLF